MTARSSLYAALERRHPTAAVRVNRAVAVGFADGPDAGLALLDTVDARTAGTALPAARAGLLARAGRSAEARAAYDEAIGRTENGAQRDELRALRAATAPRPDPAGS